MNDLSTHTAVRRESHTHTLGANGLAARVAVEVDPQEAERMGAFEEDALSEQDAADSSDDLMEVDGAMEPAFLDDEVRRAGGVAHMASGG